MKYSKRKIFCPLIILNLFIKSFVIPFVDIALSFFDSLFNSFSFDVKLFTLLSKSVLFRKLAISPLLDKFACFNLAAKYSDVNWLNSEVVIYLSWLWSVVFFSV